MLPASLKRQREDEEYALKRQREDEEYAFQTPSSFHMRTPQMYGTTVASTQSPHFEVPDTIGSHSFMAEMQVLPNKLPSIILPFNNLLF